MLSFHLQCVTGTIRDLVIRKMAREIFYALLNGGILVKQAKTNVVVLKHQVLQDTAQQKFLKNLSIKNLDQGILLVCHKYIAI